MRKEFYNLYYSEIKPLLPGINKANKKNNYKLIILFYCSWCFPIVLGSYLYNIYTDNYSLTSYLWYLIIASFVSLFIIVIPILCFSDIELKNVSEDTLKKNLMRKFLNIFFYNPIWKKADKSNYYLKNITQYETQCLLRNFWKMSFDDIIKGNYKNISISIFETSTILVNSIHEFMDIYLSLYVQGLIFILEYWVLIIFVFCLILVILSAILEANDYAFIILLFTLIYILFCNIVLYLINGRFRGVIVKLDMNKKFSGHTFFHENSFTAKQIPFSKRRYQKVNLESTTFEDKYNVYSDNQVEARYILTPAFIERIENLKFAFKAKYVRGSFKDNKLTLAIHTGKDMFAMGNDFKDSDAHTFEILYDEMISILQIVDELKLNERPNL